MSLTHNSYFGGGVQSIAHDLGDATASVGIMAGGEYHFGTAAPERMTVIRGELTVLLPGSADWRSFGAGEWFDVPGDSGFDVRVAASTSYLCEYL
ncbi:MAG: pyrimidine/purine nucleoside phosphorylase [Aeromicrobium sp.]